MIFRGLLIFVIFIFIAVEGQPGWAQDYLDIDPRVLEIDSQIKKDLEALATSEQRNASSESSQPSASAASPQAENPQRLEAIFEALDEIAAAQSESAIQSPEAPSQTIQTAEPKIKESSQDIVEDMDVPSPNKDKNLSNQSSVDEAVVVDKGIKPDRPIKSAKKMLKAQEDVDASGSTGGIAGSELELFEEIPMVITASKKLQPINKAPASVYVVTQEDIKQSGSIHLWDVLREVPGMDVAASTVGQADVSMRGFNDLLTNKTLLMVDGRSIYFPVQGLITWESLPIQMEEIDRIEVVKGPVASLYGPNANLGLINVITKTPEQMRGGIFSETGGSRGNTTRRYSAAYGDKKNDFGYKVSAGWKETDTIAQASSNYGGYDALDSVQGNALVSYDLDEDSKVSLSGGISQSLNKLYLARDASDLEWFYGPLDNTAIYTKFDYENGGFSSRFVWDYYKALINPLLLTGDILGQTFEGEVRYSFDIGDKNSFILGGGARGDYFKSSLFSIRDQDSYLANLYNIQKLSRGDRTRTQGNWNYFIQDEFKLTDQLSLIGSSRLDHFTLSGNNVSSRLAAVYNPTDKDTLRLSFGNSFRNPTLSDYYINTGLNPYPGILLEPIVVLSGNRNIKPEQYYTAEFGYKGSRLKGHFRPFFDLFYTQINNIIAIDPNTTLLSPVPYTFKFRNLGEANSKGGETGFEYDIIDNFTILGNAAYNKIIYSSITPVEYHSPEIKVNSGFKLKLFNDRLNTRFMVHHVWPTEYISKPSPGAIFGNSSGRLSSYVLADAYLGYKFKPNVEVSISGFNIFDDRHYEMSGVDSDSNGISGHGDLVGRRILGKLEVKF